VKTNCAFKNQCTNIRRSFDLFIEFVVGFVLGGKEDDDFLRRIREELSDNFTMQRPPRRNESGSENDNYFYHFHGAESEAPRDRRSYYFNPEYKSRRVDRYNATQFTCERMYVMDEAEMAYKDLVIVDVQLTCNTTLSPACEEEYADAFFKQVEMEQQEVKKKQQEAKKKEELDK